eukprot:403457_1
MIKSLTSKLNSKRKLIQQNLSIHIEVLNKYHLIQDIALQKIHHAVLSSSYTIKKLVKDVIKYLKHYYHRENYHLWSVDFDDKNHNHFHYLPDQYEQISNQPLIDQQCHIIKKHLSISLKIPCKIKVPINISMKNNEVINNSEIEITAPYSEKYNIKHLIDDAKKEIKNIYKNKMYIYSIEMRQQLMKDNVSKSWNTPLLFHTINDKTNHLESLHLSIVLKHTNCQKTYKYKKPTKFQRCWYMRCHTCTAHL